MTIKDSDITDHSKSISTQKSKVALLERLAQFTTGYVPATAQEQQEKTYYDYPVLKQPVWRWEIVWYFFCGGLASGCYILASLARLFGSGEDHTVTRTGYYLSLLALLPCPPLLIKDLGRPERFLNMLRVFKVRSPMSMGVYGLLVFSIFSGISAINQAAQDGFLGKWWGSRLLARLPQRLIALPGILCATFLGGYTGVLLATTSIPLWSRSKMLGAVFISSALSTSCALITLILRIIGAPSRTFHKLERIEWSALFIETVALLTFLRGSGRAARPLVGTNPQELGLIFWRYMAGTGLLFPWLLQTIVLLTKKPTHNSKQKGGIGLFISVLVLIGGYFLRYTMIYAGHVSSKDARTTLWNARR